MFFSGKVDRIKIFKGSKNIQKYEPNKNRTNLNILALILKFIQMRPNIVVFSFYLNQMSRPQIFYGPTDVRTKCRQTMYNVISYILSFENSPLYGEFTG